MENLKDDLAALLNGYSQEGNSNTPDFLLARYLLKCLKSYEETVDKRDEWLRQNKKRIMKEQGMVEAQKEGA